VVVVAAVACIGLSGRALAQQLKLELPQGPFYVGATVEFRIIAEGFAAEPTPTITAPDPVQGELEFLGAQPSTSTSIVIVGGQVRRTEEVSFVYTYRYRATEPGRVDVGPFSVQQGDRVRQTRKTRLELRSVPTSGRLAVSLELPAAGAYVGERVPVTVRFRLEAGLRENLHRYVLRVPLFDRTEQFQFLDSAPVDGTTDVKIETARGTIELRGRAREVTRGGETFLEVSVQRTAMPLRPGTLEIPETTLDVDEGIRFRRDLFGGRQATRVRKLRATDPPKHFVVKRIPRRGMPASYAGAVGTGFSLSVAADRTVVQAGDPITLSLELRGDGNLETAGLPTLDTEGLLPAAQFRVPSGQLAGRIEEGTKKFSATVRVLDANLSEIPALEYAWFDPKAERFETTTSQPIALSVRDAEVISARDVERQDPVKPARASQSPGSLASGAGASLVLTGADLAIERDPDRLVLQAGDTTTPLLWVSGLYAGSLLLLVAAGLDWRRRRVDPAIAERRSAIETARRRIRAAAALPSHEASAEVARALRELHSRQPEAGSAELEAFLGECDALSYAPEALHDGSRLDAARLALEFVSRFEAEP
jgi:hypothetical protein